MAHLFNSSPPAIFGGGGSVLMNYIVNGSFCMCPGLTAMSASTKVGYPGLSVNTLVIMLDCHPFVF